jgi:polyisoprenoid-binding protein YceI
VRNDLSEHHADPEESTVSATTTALPTGTWNVDPSHSRIGFRVKHLGISTVRGEFHEYTGQLVIAEDGTATASGTIKVNSIDTSEADRDTHLKAPDFFDVESYPEITFQSTSVVAIDEETYEVTGDLTMHGVTKPVTLKAEVGGVETDPFGKERVGLEATGELSRSDYGMKFNMALGSGNLAVSDKVRLDLDISAVKQTDAA